MKKNISIILGLILVIALTNIFSNPLQIFFINEFMFDSAGWKLELHPTSVSQDSLSLDNGYLTSKTDTAEFNIGIYLKPDRYTVITQSDLQSEFNIDNTGDTVSLYVDEIILDKLCFGTPGNYAPAPVADQSICLRIYSDNGWQQYYYYLDNTPTFGFENDTLNARGNIEGYIKDSLNNPIEEVKVIYDYMNNFPVFVETNSSGYFILRDYSILKRLEFQKEGYFSPDTLIQIWPDSTVNINIQMQTIVGITGFPGVYTNTFELKQNYPNPFNSSTSFIYSLAEDGFAEINIYDEKGELVQKLFNGMQSKGMYRVIWNVNNLASGIYFYELKAGNQKFTRKCLLLK